jgi:two-component system, cell cycle sensor histidine kinase and response regulator CckA
MVAGAKLATRRDLLALVREPSPLEPDRARELGALLERAVDAMLWLDREGTVRWCNDAALALFVRTRDDLIGVALAELASTPPGALEVPLATLLDEVAGRGAGATVSVSARHADGTSFPLELSLSPLHGRESGLLAVCRDGSARVRLEAQLQQAQKMEAVGRLAGGIAHDLNNVLTVVRSFGELAQEELAEGSAAHDHIGQVLKAAERSAKLTRQLLAFSRRQPVASRVVSFNEIVRDTESMLRRTMGEDVEFHTSFAPRPWAIDVDPSHFEQVLLNLVVNARDAMEHGGRLTIETSNCELDEAYATAHAVTLPPGRYACLAVTDSGTGIPVELRQRIFEPFFTTKPTDKGTGLGLSTCYGIVKQASGVIWVYSELGVGTTFKLYVPCTDRCPEDRPVLPNNTRHLGGTETLLVVEDDSQVRAVVADTLRRYGYHVLCAQHGLDALRIADAHAGPIDMLVSDVVMPRMGGPELAQLLQSASPDLRVMFISGYSEHAAVNHGLLQAGATLLEKPFSRALLLERVRAILDDRSRIG